MHYPLVTSSTVTSASIQRYPNVRHCFISLIYFLMDFVISFTYSSRSKDFKGDRISHSALEGPARCRERLPEPARSIFPARPPPPPPPLTGLKAAMTAGFKTKTLRASNGCLVGDGETGEFSSSTLCREVLFWFCLFWFLFLALEIKPKAFSMLQNHSTTERLSSCRGVLSRENSNLEHREIYPRAAQFSNLGTRLCHLE